MLKRGIGIAAIAAAGALLPGAPAGASENGNHHGGGHGQAVRVAVAACRAERQDLGREAFGERYGRHPMRSCLQETVGEARNAAQECRAERDEIGADAFGEEYGTNDNGRNAFGQCVRQHVSGDDAGDEDCTPGDGTGTPGDGGAAGAADQRPSAEHGAAQADDCSADDGGDDDGSADDGSTDGGGHDDGADDGGVAA